MKVALILSGDVRCFRDCYPSLESNVLNYNDCDIYMHAYNDDSIDDAISLYKPKSLLIDEKKDQNHSISSSCFHNKPPEADPFSTFCMWSNIKKSFNLVKGHYDMILKTRYDVKYCEPLRVDRLDPLKLHIPRGGDWREGMFDMLSVSSPLRMKLYCDLVDRINEYSTIGVPCHSEIMLRYHLESNKVEVNRFDFTVLLRKKFDKPWIEDRVFTIT